MVLNSAKLGETLNQNKSVSVKIRRRLIHSNFFIRQPVTHLLDGTGYRWALPRHQYTTKKVPEQPPQQESN